MENFRVSGFSGVAAVMKKRRSVTSRRPRPDAQLLLDSRSTSTPSSSTPSLSSSSKLSPDDNGGSDASFRRKEYYLNSPPPRTLSVNVASSKKIRRDDKIYGESDGSYGGGSSRGGHGSDLKRCSEGVLAPAKWKSTSKAKESSNLQLTSPDGNAGKSGDVYNMHQAEGASDVKAENKLRKVRLKVGGVTRTLHAKSVPDIGAGGSFSAKPPRSSDASRHQVKFVTQDYSDGHSPPERVNNLQRDMWKDSDDLGFSQGTKEGAFFEASSTKKQVDKLHGIQSSEPTRKSKRVPKKRVFDDGEEDDEIHYLEKLKSPKLPADQAGEFEENNEDGAKKRKISKLSKGRNTTYEVDEDYVSSRSIKENKKRLRTGKESEDTDYVEEEEPASDEVLDGKRKKQKATSDSQADVRIEPLTTRQRALQSGRGGNGESLIEFPDGLPSAPSRKTREKLSEVEIQAKKAEAAQRRKMQVEKQAREIEAAAIRKILGHDSDKKKEEKKQKELEEKEKAAKSRTLGPSTIRWVMGPNGTTVTFADDVGLPVIFRSKPCNYPPPREKCAGPLCSNPYKYRDSKSNLPLCSLECYKAVKVPSH